MSSGNPPAIPEIGDEVMVSVGGRTRMGEVIDVNEGEIHGACYIDGVWSDWDGDDIDAEDAGFSHVPHRFFTEGGDGSHPSGATWHYPHEAEELVLYRSLDEHGNPGTVIYDGSYDEADTAIGEADGSLGVQRIRVRVVETETEREPGEE